MLVVYSDGLTSGAVQGAARFKRESRAAAGRHAQLQAAQEPGRTRIRVHGLACLLLLCSRWACYHVRKADTSGFLTQGSATTSMRSAGSPEASGLAYEMTRWPAHQHCSLILNCRLASGSPGLLALQQIQVPLLEGRLPTSEHNQVRQSS